jgi:acyl-CoA thioester hydrolase
MSRKHVIPVPIRWRDLDALGHVNHATYLVLLGEARDAWLTQFGIGPEHYVVAALTINYRSAITLTDSPVQVELAVQRIGSKSVTTRELIVAGDAVRADAQVTIVVWDQAGQSSRALTPGERAAFSEATLGD